MTRYCFFVSIIAVLLLAVPVRADEVSVAEEVERRIHELKERVMAEVLEQIRAQLGTQQMTWLGKTIKMEFKLEPPDKGDKPHSISVAGRSYSLNAMMTSKTTTAGFDVRGNVSLMPDKQKVGITFHSNMHFSDGEHTGRVSADGSAVVEIGGSTTLANLGGKSLVVAITEIK